MTKRLNVDWVVYESEFTYVVLTWRTNLVILSFQPIYIGLN